MTRNLKPVFCLLLLTFAASDVIAVNFPDSVETFIFSGILFLKHLFLNLYICIIYSSRTSYIIYILNPHDKIFFKDGEPRGGRQAELESSNPWRAAPCPGETSTSQLVPAIEQSENSNPKS